MNGEIDNYGPRLNADRRGSFQAQLVAPPCRRGLLVLSLCLATAPAAAQERVLDSFETLSGWTTHPSDGVSLRLASDRGYGGRAMRMDFDFHGGGGYAIARKEIALDFPANYEFSFWIRGDAPANNIEFKLVDASGDNVWWVNRRDFAFPEQWQKVTFKKRHIQFAWGPAGGGEMKRMAALEISITAGRGGKGSVWLDELTFTEREPVVAYNLTPAARASSSAPGSRPDAVLDGDAATAWRSAPASGANQAWLALDFLRTREYGGLVVDWDPADYSTDYEVQTSADGARWETVYTVSGGNGGRDYIFLPETESRHVRLALARSSRGRGYAVRNVAVQPLAWSASRNDFFAAVAKDAPRGAYPRYLTGEQSYWTVVGVDADTAEGMLNADGMLETGKGSFSVEPFLYADGRLVTWSDARATPSLEKGYLPIPSVAWRASDLGLTITAFADGEPGKSSLYARYRVQNRAAQPKAATLYLALRPFQVNPSWQFLGTTGGWAPVRELAYDGRAVRVNGTRSVVPITRPSAFGAATFDQGNVVESLRDGKLPPRTVVADSSGGASGALAYSLTVPAGGTRDVFVAVPLHDTPPAVPAALTDGAAAALGAARLAVVARSWDSTLNRVSIELPPSARKISETLKSTVGYILINRDGDGIQPGSRSYERSWVRDGSLTSAALLRLGHEDAARAFAEWYAPYQYESGKVPCCVDRRGADPVPENDSHGQLIYLIAENYRYTRDTAFLARMWPHVAKAAAYIDSLRHERMTPEYQRGEKRAYYGLVPQSISHEGYSAKPMHSYWDDAFVLRGLKDAVVIAHALGKTADERRFAAMRDEFRRDLMASYRLAMQQRGIDFLPGSVELGDFDATSTTVAVAPGGELANLPEPALRNTFDEYWEQSKARIDNTKAWENYTPYELRTVGTFVRLGERRRAHAMLDFFLKDQRPAAWNQWAEVVWHDPKTPKFIGDMPHTWVGSDFIRSVADMFAFDRESDSALVIGAGVRPSWVAETPGVAVRGLRTYYGPLSYTMRGDGSTVRVHLERLARTPPGGVVLHSPLDKPIKAASVDGALVKPTGPDEVRLPRNATEVVLKY